MVVTLESCVQWWQSRSGGPAQSDPSRARFERHLQAPSAVVHHTSVSTDHSPTAPRIPSCHMPPRLEQQMGRHRSSSSTPSL